MYKNKDGKVIASLTEVKNKTGDIFAIVDEFGEISLTSYNKVRYKIIKVDIENIVDINKDGPIPQIATAPKKNSKTVELEVRDDEPIVAEEAEPVVVNELEAAEEAPEAEISETEESTVSELQSEIVQPEPEEAKLIDKTIDVQAWNREGNTERQFSLKAIRPLIS
ncbi:hypothetical protein BROC_01802 [Candidatus Brocadiaceae bacterium]|jgi:hypothetical protein|nr:hypothetical protein BROC_01802 [Candidatus Brocadiaceae bacterium]